MVNRSEESKERRRIKAREKWALDKDVLNSKKRDSYKQNKIEINEEKKKKYDPVKKKNYREKSKEKRKTTLRSYYIKNKEKLLVSSQLRSAETKDSRRNYRINNWRNQIINTIKKDANIKGIEFSISINDIKDPANSVCPCFGTKFEMGIGVACKTSATLDRINPNIGYLPDNIQVMSKLFNDIKNDADHNLIRKVGETVLLMENNVTITNDYSDFMKSKRQVMISQKRRYNKKKHNYEFTIEWHNLSLPEFCPCTNEKIDYLNQSKNWKLRPSIDRIDNNKGYTPDNVWVISAYANAIKNEATGFQIIKVASFLEKTGLVNV